MTMRIFHGSIPTSTTIYLPVQIVDGHIGLYIAWKEATSSATITLELSSIQDVAVAVAGSAWEWITSGVTITGPAASAAGSAMVNVENVRQSMARLKIATAAVTQLVIWDALADNLDAPKGPPASPGTP